MNLNGHAALSGDYNDRTRLKAVKIECFVKRIQCQCFFILPVPPTPSLATGYTDNPLSTPVSHIKPDEQNLKEGYPVNNRIFREGVHHFTSCGGSGSGIQWVTPCHIPVKVSNLGSLPFCVLAYSFLVYTHCLTAYPFHPITVCLISGIRSLQLIQPSGVTGELPP